MKLILFILFCYFNQNRVNSNPSNTNEEKSPIPIGENITGFNEVRVVHFNSIRLENFHSNVDFTNQLFLIKNRLQRAMDRFFRKESILWT